MSKNFWANEIKVLDEHYYITIAQEKGDWSHFLKVKVYKTVTKKNFFGKTVSFYDYWFEQSYVTDSLTKGVNTILEEVTTAIVVKLREAEKIKRVRESLDKWTIEK